MVIRELREDEWHRIDELPDWQGFRPSPATSKFIVAEENGQLIGAWAAVQVWHCEGFWVHPDHRKKSRLPVRLVAAMRALLDQFRVKRAVCNVNSPEIAGYVERLGMKKLPVESYLFEVRP